MYNRKKKFAGKILFLLLIVAGILGGIYYVKVTYTIKDEKVYVEGNVHYTAEEIKAIVMEGALGNNSLYLSMKYKNKGVEDIPFVDVMDVKILAPDSIKITVYEKALAGCVRYMDTYMYFDKDGCVVESSTVRTVGVPLVAGLSFDYMVLGEPLPVEDTEVFNTIFDLAKLLNKAEQEYNCKLNMDKMYFHSSGEVTLYFGGVRVNLGKDKDTLEAKIMRLPKYLQDLEGKSGVLQMEKYVEGNVRFTFKPDKNN